LGRLQPSLRGCTHFAREIFEILQLDMINTTAARLAAVLIGRNFGYGLRRPRAISTRVFAQAAAQIAGKTVSQSLMKV